MSGSVVKVRRVDDKIQATCSEHGAVGLMQGDTAHGRNAVGAEMRAHLAMEHVESEGKA